ncbi:MAG: LysM domain-containing protein [Bryobacteraceae bacterium]|nr:LysM domain-containing protein [Bryobacteraceae bacterium]
MASHTVAQGECLSSIAERYGFDWSTLWNHPSNAQLKQLRQDPNVIYPGDVVEIPERTEKKLDAATDALHNFKKKGPAQFVLRLLDGDQPIAGQEYDLVVDGRSFTGSTDGDGFIRQTLPPAAQSGRLTVGSGSTRNVYELDFGTVDPVTTESGVKGRLSDLGYGVDNLGDAIKAFKAKHSLSPVDDQINDAFRNKLKEVYGL